MQKIRIVNILIDQYSYPLPDNKIAKYPLPQRDLSKLLVFKDNIIEENVFKNISNYIPEGSHIIFNNTKVVPARLFFKKESGASIEIFCLEPHNPLEYNMSFDATCSCSWSAVVGNSKKWKGGVLLFNSRGDINAEELNLKAELISKVDDKCIVNFSWDGGHSFSTVLDICGNIPIPPYLNRDTETIDTERYQTTYAKTKGSVAAPTAGLHFTSSVIDSLKMKGIKISEVCLHVGAGTFIPVKSEDVINHKMHAETISISLTELSSIYLSLKNNIPITCIGTTSIRTIESLYYFGCNIYHTGEPNTVTQWQPYNTEYNLTILEAIEEIINWMKKRGIDKFQSKTEIIIVPGFKFKIANALVTNFHQPKSTLLLLIASFVGNQWREIYDYSLNNNFRFLSYGDSSILFRNNF